MKTNSPETLCRMFTDTVERYGERPSFATKVGDHFESVTYRELHRRVLALATAMASRGVGPRDAVGIISDNRLEWIVSDLACLMNGSVDVPRGSDSTVPEIAFILKHSDAVAAFVENEAQLAKVLSIEGLAERFHFIAVMDSTYRPTGDPKITTVADLVTEGQGLRDAGNRVVEERAAAVTPADRATIIYTSGTTGEPKGVVLLHRCIMHNVRLVPPLIGINSEDRFLSLLPPWHIFERTVEYVIVASGSSLSYTAMKSFAPDMVLVRPTFIPSVPRIWEGVYGKVMAAMAKEPPIRQKLFGLLLAVGLGSVRASRILSNEDAVFEPESAWRRGTKRLGAVLTLALLWLPNLLAQKKFAAVRAKTGGCLRAAVSGGGALPAYVDDFFAAVGITLLEGYGLTETSPVIGLRLFDRRVAGTVGPPVPETEVKVVDEQNRPLGPGKKGLIKVRGALVMAGYHKREDLTRQTIDEEGWLNTGDLGMFTVRGELAIRGRAKETIVLLGGENVEPNPIEDKITESRYISQVMVVGQDRKALGALVVPDTEAVRDYFRKHHKELPADAPLSGLPEVAELVRAEIGRLITTHHGFRPFEKISRVRLLDREFAVGEELTHTLKKKRNFIYDKYHREIEELYS